MTPRLSLLAFLLLPALAFAQPATKATPTKAKVVAVTKAPAPAASLPALVKAHVVVAPASQPASAPAPVVAKAAPTSQPTTVAGWKQWLADNWMWVLFVVVIPSLINGLKKKGVREGIIGFLESVIDRFSATTNKDSPGTLKWPGTASKPPRR